MSELMQANRQWSIRPDDERFCSIQELHAFVTGVRDNSRGVVVSSKVLELVPDQTDQAHGLELYGPNGHGYAPTHWSFGQLATLSGAPAGYLRGLPAPLAADCINYGLKFKREVEDVGVLLYRNGGTPTARCVTGSKYGRIWNADATQALVNRGFGMPGSPWQVPGEFGQQIEVTKRNTTLYASDRDMFVFLADEQNRIEVPNRRNGKAGSLARGFFLWNSEVGSATFGVGMFLFDYVCCNRIVWGAEQYKEIRIRHTSGAPERWLSEVEPVLLEYAASSPLTIEHAIASAQATKAAADEAALDKFLADRFGKSRVAPIKLAHIAEEGRPIESLWDVTTAATAFARGIQHQDARVEIERAAGDVMKLAA